MGKATKAIAGYALMAFGVFLAGIGYSAAGLRIAKFGQLLMVSGAIDLVSRALMPGKPRATRSGQALEYFGTVEQRRIIYGTVKVSGLHAIPPFTSGTDNGRLHQVNVLAGHEVAAIGDVYFDQVVIAGAASPPVIASITGAASDGRVVSGAYVNRAWIRRYTGAPTGSPEWTSDYILTNEIAQWTSAHRGKGIPYLALTFLYDEEVYKTGKPEVSCIVQGAKCYDPRLDASPGASPTNPSYIAFTANPALCLAHYMTHSRVGMGESASRIDWDLVVAAADICDEQVAIPPVASPQTAQNRYTCNVVLEVAATEAERRENIKTLAGAMMGHVTYRGNEWRMYAGTDLTSSFALTDDDVVGKMSFRTELPSNEKYNYVRGQFVDTERNWQLSEFEPRGSSAYETTDGDRKSREVSFPTCTNKYEAQRNAIIVLKRSRLKRQVTLELGMSAYRIRPWDVGTLTLAEMGWTAQSVRCVSWGFNPDGMIEATFMEEDSTAWADPAVGDYGVQTGASNPTPGDFTPSAPVSLTAGSLSGGIAFNWRAAGSTPSATTYTIYEHTESTPFESASVLLSGVSGTSAAVAKGDTTTRYYWVTAVSTISGNESGPYPSNELLSPSVTGVSGVALTGGGDGLNVASAYIYRRTTTGTPPALPSVTATFEFATGAITDLNNGWTDTVPAITGSPENHYLWMSRATASGASPTDTIASGEWQTAVILAQRGSDGTDGEDGAPGDPGDAGYNAATLTAYKRAATTPGDNPGAVTYTFATLDWTPGNSWTKTIPTGSNPVWAVAATAYGTGTEDSIAAGEWSSPVQVFADGAAGLNVASVFIYQRTTTDSAPTLPSATATYTFATGDVTNLNNGWYDTIPAVTGSPENRFLWASTATASSTSATDTILSTEWAAAQHLARDGADGADGLTSAITVNNFTVVCDAYGTPRSGAFDNANGVWTVWRGSTNVTATATYAISATSVSGSPEVATVTGQINTTVDQHFTGPIGAYRITAMTATSGYIDMTATYNSITIKQRFSVQKALAGEASSSASDTTFTGFTNTTYDTTPFGGVIQIPVGPNGTVHVSSFGEYTGTGTSGSFGVVCKVQWRESGGDWADFTGANTTGTTAIYQEEAWDPGNYAILETTMAAPTTSKIYEFQILGYKSSSTGGTVTWTTNTRTLNAWWTPT